MPDFTLNADGIAHGGWTKLSITRSMEQLAHSFSVAMTDKWADQKEPVPLHKFDSVNVEYSDDKRRQLVTTGFIDKTSLRYSATERTLGFIGRSITEDLVDCAAIRKPGSWINVGLLKIAQDLCAPYAISVSAMGADLGGLFKQRFTIQDGETVFECLDRACRMRGVVMNTTGAGSLIFQQCGQTKVATVLEYGKNILECDSYDSMEERFSDYIVKIQTSAGGLDGDTYSGDKLVQKATSKDGHVPRYRPTIVMGETGETGTLCQKRADWECAVRAGRANRVTYKVDGWAHSQGLWEPNTIVHVIDRNRECDDDLLIVTTTATRDGNEGTHTDLECTFPEGFLPKPIAATKSTKKNPFEMAPK